MNVKLVILLPSCKLHSLEFLALPSTQDSVLTCGKVTEI